MRVSGISTESLYTFVLYNPWKGAVVWNTLDFQNLLLDFISTFKVVIWQRGPYTLNMNCKSPNKHSDLALIGIVLKLWYDWFVIFKSLYQVFHLAVEGTMEITPWPAWCEVVSIISTILLVFNSSINIIIYCCKDNSFRKVLFVKLNISEGIGNGDDVHNERWLWGNLNY